MENFGDGTESAENSPTHSYLLKGVYTISVEISDALGARTRRTLSVPVQQTETATSPKHSFALNFTLPKKDAFDIQLRHDGFSTPLSGAVRIVLGTTRFETVDVLKGKGKGLGSFRQTPGKKEVRYTLRNADLALLLKPYGISAEPGTRQVQFPFAFEVNGVIYGGQYPLTYSSKGKSGKAK